MDVGPAQRDAERAVRREVGAVFAQGDGVFDAAVGRRAETGAGGGRYGCEQNARQQDRGWSHDAPWELDEQVCHGESGPVVRTGRRGTAHARQPAIGQAAREAAVQIVVIERVDLEESEHTLV